MKFQATVYANSIGGYYFETSSFTDQGYHCIEKAFTQTALGLIHLSGESNSLIRRYESQDQLPSVVSPSTPSAEQNLMMASAVSLGIDSTLDENAMEPGETGRVENVAFSIDHIAHGDEHRTGCCW